MSITFKSPGFLINKRLNYLVNIEKCPIKCIITNVISWTKVKNGDYNDLLKALHSDADREFWI